MQTTAANLAKSAPPSRHLVTTLHPRSIAVTDAGIDNHREDVAGAGPLLPATGRRPWRPRPRARSAGTPSGAFRTCWTSKQARLFNSWHLVFSLFFFALRFFYFGLEKQALSLCLFYVTLQILSPDAVC